MARPTKEYRAFTDLVDRLLTVPKATIAGLMAAHREAAALKPRKRGPKPGAGRLPANGPESESDP